MATIYDRFGEIIEINRMNEHHTDTYRVLGKQNS